ncbi:stage V sporulation protein AD [Anopheles sinensis]|uniref:Stage V sporulation protein AD n=1 Tax=Anopheles sinensis TaxID=74873 RepID=A0A084WQI8_ANOSI|nr:stage V sporulation protein AD [Anopheles sinensis]
MKQRQVHQSTKPPLTPKRDLIHGHRWHGVPSWAFAPPRRCHVGCERKGRDKAVPRVGEVTIFFGHPFEAGKGGGLINGLLSLSSAGRLWLAKGRIESTLSFVTMPRCRVISKELPWNRRLAMMLLAVI